VNQVEQNIARLAMVVLRALPFGGAILDRAYSRQMLIYFFIGGFSACLNVAMFSVAHYGGMTIFWSAVFAYIVAATANYLMCIRYAFRSPKRWSPRRQKAAYVLVAATMTYVWLPYPFLAKAAACFVGYFINFVLRKYLVFRELVVS
jgi:putative flippase GtrA